MISIDKEIWKLLKDVPRITTIKIFFYIATNQPEEGIRGYKTSKTQLMRDINSGRTNFFRDLKWLKENMLIQELKVDKKSDFMVNPHYVTNDYDGQARIDEWIRRCNLDIQREARLFKKRLQQTLIQPF